WTDSRHRSAPYLSYHIYHSLSFFCSTHFANVPASHSLVRRCFRIRPVFSFGRDRKILRTYLTSCCPSCICEHWRHKTTLLAADFLPYHIVTFPASVEGSRPQFYLFTVSPLCMHL